MSAKGQRKIQPLAIGLTHRTRIALWTVSIWTGLVGLVNVVSAVSPSLPGRVRWLMPLFPFPIRAGGHVFAALTGFLLLTLAANLLRRKRVAWLLTVALLGISIVSHLVKGLDYEESLLAIVPLIQLIVMRKTFTARSDRPSIFQGIRVLIEALIFTVAYGTVGFYILDGRFNVNGEPVNFGLLASIEQTLAIFFTEDNAGLEPTTRYSAFFINSIYIVGAATLAYALFMLLRPVLLRGDPATIAERRRARDLIDRYGQTSLARLSLLKDKSYYFSPSGQSVIAYVAKGRAAIALGDPIGASDDRVEAILSFSQFCDLNDWFPAFYETSADQLERYCALGFQQIQIGEEAIVDLTTFTLKGKAAQNLRTALNRSAKAGYRFNLYESPIQPELFQQLKPVSDEWLKDKQGSEKQFSIGWFDENYLRDCLIAVVYDADNRVVAFANLLSGYNRREVTIDLMRHRLDAEKGTMDFLFVSMFQHFKEADYDSFNLSLSPLAGVGAKPSARRVEKALNYLFNHLNQFYNFKGLHQFKEKFQPRWEPRYLVFPSRSALPEVILGLVRADSGDRLFEYFQLEYVRQSIGAFFDR